MSVRVWLLGTLALLVSLTFACDLQGQLRSAPDGTAINSTQAGDRVLGGQLRTVDPDRETFIVAFDDDLYEFVYTDSTEVVGGGPANVRGLRGNTGTEITVYYRRNPFTSRKTAERIEIR